MSQRRVAVTGLGIVSPYGGDIDSFYSHLLSGVSAVDLLSIEDPAGDLNIPAVQCQYFNPEELLDKPLIRTMDRFSQLGATAAFSAWKDAGFSLEEPGEKLDYGLSWGTGVGGVSTFEQGYKNLYRANKRLASPLSIVMAMNNSCAAHISIQLGLGGPCMTHSVACASSTVAIGEAFHHIRSGRASMMMVGGSEAPLVYGVLRAWDAMRILAPADADSARSACRPFSTNRGGLVLGEGAGAMVLEDWDHAVNRGARIYAELAGYGMSCDHSHLVHPDARGEIRAIEQSLAMANLDASDIDYVNAHATSTKDGDIAEINALKAVFGDHAATLPISSTKSMLGHMLGATGVVEAIVTVMALKNNVAPPTAHLTNIDPECEGVHHIRENPLTDRQIDSALSNSFAFGGVNSVLAFRSPESPDK